MLATGRSPSGASKPITQDHSPLATVQRWTQRDGMSNCPGSPWLTSEATRSGRSGRTSTMSRCSSRWSSDLDVVDFHVEDHPDPCDIELLETQIRREASAAMGLGDELDLAIFVRDSGTVVAG